MKTGSFPYSYWTKILGAAIILAGIVSFIMQYHKKAIFDFNELAIGASWGLLFIFFSKERTDDEMIESLKFKALTRAVIISFSITHLYNYLLLNWSLPRPNGTILSISAYQFLALTLLIAICCFYYLKHRTITKGE